MPFDTFSGGTIQPGQVSYEAISTGADLTLAWPTFSPTAGTVAALIMDITTTAGALSILLPASNQAGTGSAMLIRNVGANQFTVKDNAGGVITTVAAGAVKYLYSTSNTTAAGVWAAFTFGTGTSAADAAALAGLGLVAITTTLNQQHLVGTDTANRSITTSDRAKMWVWTSGTVTATLPLAATAGAGFFWIAKSMNGVAVTVARAGADLIDGAASISLTGGSGAIIYTDGAAWYTVGVTASSFSSIGIGNGSMSAPSLFFTAETTTGIYRPGAGQLAITTSSKDVMRFNAVGSAVNAIDIFSAATGTSPYIKAYGTDTNVDLGVRPQGSTGRSILQDGNGNEVLIADVQTASAVNEITITNAATAGRPLIKASGGDPNVGLAIRPKGTGAGASTIIQDGSGNEVIIADVATALAVNEVTVTNAATGTPPIIKATGGDTNISLRNSPKGTGTFQITDGTDVTKVAAFDVSTVTTGTTRTYIVPNTSGGTLALTPITTATISGNTTLNSADVEQFKNITATADVTLPDVSTLSTGSRIKFKSSTEGKVRLLPQGSDTIDGDTEYLLPSYCTCTVMKTAALTYVLSTKPDYEVGMMYPNTIVGNAARRGFLFPDGTAKSRATYAGLFYASSLTGTITVTIATPGVVTWTSNKLANNDTVEFSTTGALPTGIVAGTTYFVVSNGTDGAGKFRIAATAGGAAINTTGTQSGVHTALHVPYGRGDGSTTFNVYDIRGRAPVGRDALGGTAASRITSAGSGINGDTPGASGGAETVALSTAQLATHTHPVTAELQANAGSGGASAFLGNDTATNTAGAGSGTAHNNTQPVQVSSYLVKT